MFLWKWDLKIYPIFRQLLRNNSGTLLPTFKYFIMGFVKEILWYYHSEARHGYTGAVVGLIFLIAVVLLIKLTNPLAWLRGLAIPFFIGGLIFGIGGTMDGRVTQKALPEKVGLYRQDPRTFFKEEVPKVERTHRSWFGIRLFWSIITITGLTLLLTLRKNFWLGVGLGALLLGIIGHVEEAISMKRNERYYREVLESANQATVPPARLPDNKDRVKDNGTALARSYNDHNMVIKKIRKQATRERLVYPDTPYTECSLTYEVLLLTEDLARVQTKSERQVDTTEQVSPFSASPGTQPEGKKKIMDYYRSEMMVSKKGTVRHCWFGRKHIRE